MIERESDALSWHSEHPDRVVTLLESDTVQGLSSHEAARRRAAWGANALPDSARRPALALLIAQFKSPLIYLLLVAAGIATALGEVIDAIVILSVVGLNALIGAFQEGRAERALAALRRLSEHKARVLREAQEHMIEARDIVAGDILVLGAGDAVGADARLTECAGVRAAEAALTGESVPVGKGLTSLPPETPLADRENMLYAGTYITAGRARAVTVATGTNTEIGRIAVMTASTTERKTPLERRIEQLGRYTVAGAVVMFAAVTAVGTLQGIPFAQIFMVAVSTLVGMIPEGLPVAMTIALAVGVQRMAARKAVVRRLSAVETLGATSIICSDKTGTLTRNEMTVTWIYLPDGRQVSVTGVGYAPEGEFAIEGMRLSPVDSDLRSILEAGVLCNDAQLHAPDASSQTWKPVGDPTEIALLTAAMKAGVAPPDLRFRFSRRAELPFDSAAKMMATQHDSPGRGFVVVKGAPEVVLPLCGTARTGDSLLELDALAREAIQNAADSMAARALRLLAIAVVVDATLDAHSTFAALSGRATLLGLVGQIDPPRTEVALAIRQCWDAGIRPVVVTGDHRATALAIARELGIAHEGDRAVDGLELESWSDAELDERLAGISVFARVHPAQKVRIVEAYQRRGEVVAMTGDGVNDAPALVRADVGVAMGITGTEVAKDAAKVVLGDDSFTTIVAAVEEGRVAYRNIKKAVLLLLSTSAAEVLVLLCAMLLGYPPPFAAVQILWNNLVTEGVITVNLIMEPSEGDEMQRRPISSAEPLVTRLMLARMGVMVPAIVLTTLGWFIARTTLGVPADQARTETFTLLAICEWFNVLNCRSETRSALNLGLLKNPWLLGGLVLGNLLQIAVVFWAPLSSVLHTVPFGLEEVIALGVVGSLVLWAEEARKWILRRRAAHLTPSGEPVPLGTR